MTDLILTPVLAAALANKPRRRPRPVRGGTCAESKNNYVAQTQKTKPGAPLGNRNAATRDPDVLIRRARHAEVRALVRSTYGVANLADAVARFGEQGRAVIRAGVEARDA